MPDPDATFAELVPEADTSRFAELAAATPDALSVEASSLRSLATGNRVTYSPKVFVPLTRLCRDRCGYCTFAAPPARLASPYLELDDVAAIAKAGAAAGCHEALFTLGEAPEDRWPQAKAWLDAHGYASTLDYLVEACAHVRDETGLLAHANAGALGADDLARLRRVSASQGMMLETLAVGLPCHRGCPDKEPARRLATLEAAGRLAIPFTTGLLVGIGESRVARLWTIAAIAASHLRHGHVQEVIVQNFLPKPGTGMHAAAACDPAEHRWSVAAARILLPPDVHVQAPPNLAHDLDAVLAAGIDDWGGVSPVTADHVNPEAPWPPIAALDAVCEAAGMTLAPRLTLYPERAREPDRWLDPAMRTAVLRASDAEGYGRDSLWVSGGAVAPPRLAVAPAELAIAPPELAIASPELAGMARPSVSRSGPLRHGPSRITEVLAGVSAGEEVGEEEIVALFSARGDEVRAVCEVADELRSEIAGDTVTWVANRNINYTNICTFKCRFCAFSKGPLSLNLRGDPYLLDMEEIARRTFEAWEAGATEVCLQGGIHPSFDGDYYVEVLRAVKEAAPDIHVHGFTALEVSEGARRLGEPLGEYLVRLRDAGLRSLPGTAAEILDDEVRATLCPDKITTEEWLEVHRVAHSVGLASNVTIMFGAIERPVSWARHLVATRALARETHGFTELVPLPFVHMAAPIYLAGNARRGPTWREALLMHAVGRITYRDAIPNVQASWVKLGLEGARQVLAAGGNDLGGTLMNENISRAAGAAHGQAMDEAGFAAVVAGLPGRVLRRRRTSYQLV